MKPAAEKNITLFLILLISSVLFIPFLGGVHLFDWDEVNFAESAREMIVTGDYLTVRINFQPFWEKPPLFIWMQVLSMKVFGINEFAARFPNAICGIFTLIFLYLAGRRYYGHSFGLLWIFFYAGSILPFIYFKSGIIDPWFNLFILSGIYFFIRFTEEKKLFLISLSAAFIGLAILTKGPVALLIYGLTVLIFLIIKKFRVKIRWKDIVVFTLVLAVTGGFWFILQIANGNLGIIKDFIVYQVRLFKTEDAGHGGFLFYHFVVLFFGVFPASLFAIKNLFNAKRMEEERHDFKLWMIILFWVVLLLFTLVRTKIVHYSSMSYFPLTFLGAWTTYQYIRKKQNIPAWMRYLVLFTGILYVILIFMLPFIMIFRENIISLLNIRLDEFTKGNLSANVQWIGFEGLPALVLLSGLIIFLFHIRKEKLYKGIFWLFSSSMVFILLIMILIVPKIEKYSQEAAIEFFTKKGKEDACLATIGYKSYAHYFYGNINEEKAYDRNRLLKGDIDKKVYFSSKISRKERILKEYPELKVLYEKNGFVFWVREPEAK